MLTGETITVAQLAEIYSAAPATIYNMVHAGLIPPPDFKVIKPMRWRRSTIEQWEKAGFPPQPINKEGKVTK